jgi:hypothetical protein
MAVHCSRALQLLPALLYTSAAASVTIHCSCCQRYYTLQLLPALLHTAAAASVTTHCSLRPPAAARAAPACRTAPGRAEGSRSCRPRVAPCPRAAPCRARPRVPCTSACTGTWTAGRGEGEGAGRRAAGTARLAAGTARLAAGRHAAAAAQSGASWPGGVGAGVSEVVVWAWVMARGVLRSARCGLQAG